MSKRRVTRTVGRISVKSRAFDADAGSDESSEAPRLSVRKSLDVLIKEAVGERFGWTDQDISRIMGLISPVSVRLDQDVDSLFDLLDMAHKMGMDQFSQYMATVNRQDIHDIIFGSPVFNKQRDTEALQAEIPLARPDSDRKEKITCHKCKGGEVIYYEKQTRSSDEPPTITFTCIQCRHSWRQ